MKGSGHALKIVKISMGFFLAMLAAQTLGLKYSSSAGVITLLSIQDTKRETIRVTGRRFLAFLAAMVLGPVSFAVAGYRPLAMGIFLLMFTPLCIKWGIQEGISVNTVLMTHLLAERSIGTADIANEALLLFIGTGMGILLNLYIPDTGRAIRRAQREIEEQFICLLRQMAGFLEGQERRMSPECLGHLELVLEHGERRAYENMENSLLTDTRYYLTYMGLRKNQFAILGRMRDCFMRMEYLPDQASTVSGLLYLVSRSFHEQNNALGLLHELNGVKEKMKAQPLPSNREEFENRALLYLSLLELEQFLLLKKEFAEDLTRQEINRFWQNDQPSNTF